MDFANTAQTVLKCFDGQKIQFAFIGGLALSAWGVFRATSDLDLLIRVDHLTQVETILNDHFYRQVHHSENISQYAGEWGPLGGIDIVHASRAPSRLMLERAPRRDVPGVGYFPVCLPEDLIALKMQAFRNDPRRASQDRADIEALCTAAKESSRPLSWDLLVNYGQILDLEPYILELREKYGNT